MRTAGPAAVMIGLLIRFDRGARQTHIPLREGGTRTPTGFPATPLKKPLSDGAGARTPFPLQADSVQHPRRPPEASVCTCAQAWDVRRTSGCPASFRTANGSAPLFSKTEMAECRMISPGTI